MVDVNKKINITRVVLKVQGKKDITCDEINDLIYKLEGCVTSSKFVEIMKELMKDCLVNRQITNTLSSLFKIEIEKLKDDIEASTKKDISYLQGLITGFRDLYNSIDIKYIEEEFNKIENKDFSSYITIMNNIQKYIDNNGISLEDFLDKIEFINTKSSAILLDKKTVREILASIKHPQLSMDSIFEKINLLVESLVSKVNSGEASIINSDNASVYYKVIKNIYELTKIDVLGILDILEEILKTLEDIPFTPDNIKSFDKMEVITRYININIVHIKLIIDALQEVQDDNISRG